MWTFQAHRLDVAAVISLMSPTLIKHQPAQCFTSALSSFSRDSNNGLVPTNLPWQAMDSCMWGSGTSKEVVWVGHGKVGESGGQRQRCVQVPNHHKGLQGGGDLLLRQHNWLREPPLARCSPSKGGDRPSRSHNGQRPCLSSHLPGG